MYSLGQKCERQGGPVESKMGSDKRARPSCPNIEEELRAICGPCKSSSLSYIKVMCERALLSYRHYRDVVYKTDFDENGERLKQFPVTDVCSACREAIMASTMCSNSMQLSILGMNCIKQILVPGLLDMSHKITILAVLNEVTLKVSAALKGRPNPTSGSHGGGHASLAHDKEQVLLKVIQTVILFLCPEIIEFNETIITLIVSIISTIFGLSGYYQLIQMSQLAIRQLVSLSLDYIDSGIRHEIAEDASEVVSILLIKDISIMIDRRVVESVQSISSSKTSKDSLTPLSLLKGGITIPSEICLDLWYEILDRSSPERRALLENNSDLRSLIDNVLFPALTKCIQNSCLELNPRMSQNIHQFIMFARFIRLFIRILEFNSSKNLQGPFFQDCVCNSLMSFIRAISDDNYLSIPSWSLQCILEMLSELVRSPDITLIIGNYTVKQSPNELDQEGKSGDTNLLEHIISTLNQILVSLNDQLDILHSAENANNLPVPSFLNENISLPSILLPQNNSTSIECGYFIISSSKKSSERSPRLIDVIMEDDRIYHTSKYYGFGGSQIHAGSMQSLSTLSSVVLISLKPVEISLLVFDIILNISICLDGIHKEVLVGDPEKGAEFERLILNIWDRYYTLIKQCMSYYLLRYYVYRIITFLFMISNLPEFKGKLRNILELIFESLQKYYINNQILENRILSDTVLLEKVFSVYKCFLSISYQFSESLDETSWQLLFRYMEYIDRILDIGLGPMTKAGEIKSKPAADLVDLDCTDHYPSLLKSEESSSMENGDSAGQGGARDKDEKAGNVQITKTLMAESTILRASHQAFLRDHIKNISENTMNCVIKGIYKELSFHMYRENLDICVFDYLLKQLSRIIQSIYDKMSYNLFIPIWNDKIIPLLIETLEQDNHSHTGIACKHTQNACGPANCMHSDRECPHKQKNDVENNKGRLIIKNGLEDVGIFNSIVNFLSSTITTIFKFIDEESPELMENNVQTSLLDPYLLLTGSFPAYSTLLLRSLYSIMCSTIPKLDDSTWILINVLINNVIQNRFGRHIKYLSYEKAGSNASLVTSATLSLLEASDSKGPSLGGDSMSNVGTELDYDIELLQTLFPLVEYITGEAEIRFWGTTSRISSSWNLLIESIAVFGRVNMAVENLAFQAVSLLWKLTDLIGSSLSSIAQERETGSGEYLGDGCDDGGETVLSSHLIFDQRNIKIGVNRSSKVYFSDHTSIEMVWLNIILQLEDLCKDPRQEIRNCSLRSLFSALITHCKYIKSHLLKSIIIRIIENVLSVSLEQYNHSLGDSGPGDVLSFNWSDPAATGVARQESELSCTSQTSFALEFETSVSTPSKEGLELTKMGKGDECPSLSSSLIRNAQQNQVWEGTLEIAIDGTLRVIKELSQSSAVSDEETQSICFECTMFLYSTISTLLSYNRAFDCSSGPRSGDAAPIVVYKKEIQIISIKALYELLVVSMKIGDKKLWNFGFSIYSEIVLRISLQSCETLHKLQRAEEAILTSSKDSADGAVYKSYNNYVLKLIKFYLSDKLAESLLQTIVDLLILLKEPGNMLKYRLFDDGDFVHINILLDLIISIISSTDTFIHHTVPLSNLSFPDSWSNLDQVSTRFMLDPVICGRLYKEFNDYCGSMCVESRVQVASGLWGRGSGEDGEHAPPYVPRLVNFEKDRLDVGPDSKSGAHSRGHPQLVYIESYSNSDFIHDGSFKRVGETSLLRAFHLNKGSQSGRQEVNMVYLLRNVSHLDMFSPEANYCYYLKSKEAANTQFKKAGGSSKPVRKDPDSRSYLCSIRNNNDCLSSSINSEIRFVTTIQNIGIETLQFFMMSLPTLIRSDNEHDAIHMNQQAGLKIISLSIRKLLDALVLHGDLLLDTCKIGISCKIISLLVGYNRNILLQGMKVLGSGSGPGSGPGSGLGSPSSRGGQEGVFRVLSGRDGPIFQIMAVLPYLFERLMLLMELDRERLYGIWMVAKEALLVIMHDWASFVGFLRLEWRFYGGMGGEVVSVLEEFNGVLVENIWPLFVGIVGELVREDFGFGLKVCGGNLVVRGGSPRMNHYIENYCLYFDILLVDVVMDFMLIWSGEASWDGLEMLELPYEYYTVIIQYFNGFISNSRSPIHGLDQLRKGSPLEKHWRSASASEESTAPNAFKVSGSSVNVGGHNHTTLNINYQTLKIYIIEKLFVVFDHLNSKLGGLISGQGCKGEEEVSAMMRSKVQRLVSSVEYLGHTLHEMTSNMFRSFSMEDLQSGLRPMPHLKIEEMHSLLFLIEKHYRVLRRFESSDLSRAGEIQLDILNMSRRCFGNYIENVLPELIECVTCKDPNIRQKLKSILSSLSKDISKDYRLLLLQRVE
ncbi:large low complexity protein [Cryptosporidium canis]|uniref:Large low complexity protein n=1 Tax=Cryptosporidium canis TaxID=195482 RepID=A0A9D5DGU8_9CRYT|nr:large low complexity protein [Cryptosporidium canis]